MKLLSLTKNIFSKVDDKDFEHLSHFKWTVTRKYNNNYVKRSAWINKKTQVVYLHREIMSAPKGLQVDHINGDGLDNRRSNLRICTKAQNLKNRRRQHNQSNEHKGVAKAGKKWGAKIWHNGKILWIGTFKTQIEAVTAWNLKAIELRGEFANLNIARGIEPTEKE